MNILLARLVKDGLDLKISYYDDGDCFVMLASYAGKKYMPTSRTISEGVDDVCRWANKIYLEKTSAK